jgi:hypothetical protein
LTSSAVHFDRWRYDQWHYDQWHFLPAGTLGQLHVFGGGAHGFLLLGRAGLGSEAGQPIPEAGPLRHDTRGGSPPAALRASA